MRYLAVVFASFFLSAVTVAGVTLVEPEKVDAATVGVKGCTGTIVKLTQAEKRMLDHHNKTRADRGLSRLCVHPALEKAARAHSQDMIRKDYFAHGNVGKRLHKFGYRWRTYGENIAYGSGSSGSPDAIFKAWMHSSSHRSNILSGKYKEIGIGAATGTYKGTKNVTMWTADFGSR
ncbi:MAG TPA: CAP domain-containing protein [Rubrobacteraceae bacterium]|nr:CAP domain-containing protein [Rubrobacteraceae bacterium]